MRPWKPLLAALVIFLAGAAIGALFRVSSAPEPESRDRGPRDSHRTRDDGPPGRPPSPTLSEGQITEICGRMTRDLGLTPPQSNQIQMIISDGQVRMKAIADEFMPRTREEFRRTREEIKAVLTPEQLERFEADWKKRQNRGRGRFDQSGPEQDSRRGPRGSPPPDEDELRPRGDRDERPSPPDAGQ